MTYEGLREMFEGESADTFSGKFYLTSMRGQAEGLSCADPGARTPIGVNGILFVSKSSYKAALCVVVSIIMSMTFGLCLNGLRLT